MEATVYIVILNWNGWQDTIACLQSCFGLKGVSFRCVVCDNGSTDNSLNYLDQWANGELTIELPENERLRGLITDGGLPKRVQKISRSAVLEENAEQASGDLIIVDNGANLGFAAGNNSGIQYAMQQADMSHVWLLNNDTLVEPNAALALIEREQNCQPCVVGSLLKFYDDPTVIQAVGGNAYNRFTGIASESLGRYKKESDAIDLADYESQLDYICGASMLLSKPFLEDIGVMEERYFLYYEEIDWAVRSRSKYPLRVALDSIVYHKEGSSIGSASFDSAPSPFSEFCKVRAKLWFTAKFYPLAYISCYLFSAAQALNRLRQGYPENAKVICKVLLGNYAFKKEK